METPELGRYPALVATDPFDRILGSSAAAEAIRAFGRRAAAVDAPVLLLGESGTGKGVLARAIHDASPRARRAFISVNCAAVPESLFESEFFGHVRGAFTGAQYAHKGLFEQAESGSLFLDEIAELPVTMQAKLLTVLEDRQIRRVGGERSADIDLRIISATSRDLPARMAEGLLRVDLYHRISILRFRLPPLRERAQDISELAIAFLHAHATRYARGICVFDGATLELLSRYWWPGNVRELSNAVEAALVASPGSVVTVDPDSIRPELYVAHDAGAHAAALPDERARIAEALRQARGNKSRAARSLGMGRTTLWQKLKQLDGDVDEQF